MIQSHDLGNVREILTFGKTVPVARVREELMSIFHLSLMSYTIKQPEVFLPAHARRSQVILDDENRHLRPLRYHNRALDSGLCIHVMVSLYSDTSKARFFKDPSQPGRGYGRYPWHRLLRIEMQQLGGDHPWGRPIIGPFRFIARFFQDVFQCAHLG